jgi:SagB-type dehydrogenase family enzyme
VRESVNGAGNDPASSPSCPEAMDLRFSDAFGVTLDGNTIVILNTVTGASHRFPKETQPVLDQFMNWTSTAQIVQTVLATDGDAAALNRAIEVIDALLRLGVLTTRREEWSGARLPPPGAAWNVAMGFLLATRTGRETVYAVPAEFYDALAQKALFCRQPSAFYERVDAPFHPLPAPKTDDAGTAASFPSVLLRRRTSRRFSELAIDETELSTLLYFGWGMTGQVTNPLGDVFIRKTSPSGGSLHPIEVYPIVLNVEGVPRGCYHYSVRRHGLEELSLEDPASWIVKACGDQAWVAEAAVVFLCTAFLPRTAWKYDFSRVARAVISEIGYTGQSAFLAATWLGLGAFTTAALRDEIFEEKFGLDPTREPAFSVTGVGHLEESIPDHSRPRTESLGGVEGS